MRHCFPCKQSTQIERQALVLLFHSRLSATLAWRVLAYDRVRFWATIVGVVFSVVLVGIQCGLLLNFINTTSVVPAQSKADIIITAPGVRAADISTAQLERRRYQALSVEGVDQASVTSVDFVQWKRPDGVREAIVLVGNRPNSVMGLPWRLESGNAADLLRIPDGVIIDRLYQDKLGGVQTDDLVEINDVRARVVGFTSGIRTFTQAPYVFTSLEMARRITGLRNDHISYVMVKVRPGYAPAEVARNIAERIPDTQVLTSSQFAFESAYYWLFTTGAGVSLIMSALLGLCVGGAIVTQTLYTNTLEHLPEYAALRAIGGPLSYLRSIVLGQAIIAAIIGYTLGIGIVMGIVWANRNASAAPELPLWLASVIAVNTLVVCMLAASVSIRKLRSIDPVTVFR